MLRRHRAWSSSPFIGLGSCCEALVNVAAEWTMLATAFNLRTLCREWSSSPFIGLFNGPEPHPVS